MRDFEITYGPYNTSHMTQDDVPSMGLPATLNGNVTMEQLNYISFHYHCVNSSNTIRIRNPMQCFHLSPTPNIGCYCTKSLVFILNITVKTLQKKQQVQFFTKSSLCHILAPTCAHDSTPLAAVFVFILTQGSEEVTMLSD